MTERERQAISIMMDELAKKRYRELERGREKVANAYYNKICGMQDVLRALTELEKHDEPELNPQPYSVVLERGKSEVVKSVLRNMRGVVWDAAGCGDFVVITANLDPRTREYRMLMDVCEALAGV